MRKALASFGLGLVVFALLASACAPPNNSVTPRSTTSPSETTPPAAQTWDSDNLTVDQASELIGLPVPVPEYLPPGYAIASVRIKNTTSPPGPYWDIEMAITSPAVPGPITLSTVAGVPGMKLPPSAEMVMIGTSRAWVNRSTVSVGLLWTDRQGRQISLRAGTDVQFDDVLKIAKSLTSPPMKAVEVTKIEEAPLLVMRGDSQDLLIHVQNNSTKNVDVSFTLDNGISKIPQGISISVDKESFALSPGQRADITAKIAVSADAPSPTFAHLPASSILSTNPPPPFSGGQTQQPSYFLSFRMISRYPAADLTIREGEGFSRQLLIDPPLPLPPGMVSLKEAQAAADFPVSRLLPAYLPEGTNPPPLGYGISEQEPHIVTARYSSFTVEFSPEPGVKEPPAGFAGLRDTIRNRSVVIGSNRIDWWADDIHRIVTSETLPMSELRLIAESMMLISIHSGSWIGMK